MRIVSPTTDFGPLCGPEVVVYGDPDNRTATVLAIGFIGWACHDPGGYGWRVMVVDNAGPRNAWLGGPVELLLPFGAAVKILCDHCGGSGSDLPPDALGATGLYDPDCQHCGGTGDKDDGENRTAR